MTPEGKVKQQVKKALKERNAYYAMVMQNGFGVVGIPDFVACVPVTITEDMVGKTIGVFAGVETKAPGKIKNTTPNQKKNLQEIYDAHGMAVVVDDLERTEMFLDLLTDTGVPSYYVP